MVQHDHSDQRLQVLERLLRSVNDHDIEALVSCFADDYVNETPVHPPRGFRGNGQVRRNWVQIFAAVPDVHAQLSSTAVEGNQLWTEWEMSGSNRQDGSGFLMRGVVIFGIVDNTIASARFYLEPVEQASGGVDAHMERLLGEGATLDSSRVPS